jgi:hypothetical protein
MKYTTKIDIRQPLSKVIDLFDSTENMYKWQTGLVSFEHISGKPGEEGSRSRLNYNMGKREVEMIETITKRNFPDEFSGTYEAKGVWNHQQHFFEAVDDQTTRWTSVSEFRCSGFMKLMCWLMPGAFRKQTLKMMNQFKTFAEAEG